MTKTAKETKAEINHYHAVCLNELEKGHGKFLTCFMESFVFADTLNATILLTPMKKLAEKYKLRKVEQEDGQ